MSKKISQEELFDKLHGVNLESSPNSFNFPRKTMAAIVTAGVLSLSAQAHAEPRSVTPKQGLLAGKRTVQFQEQSKNQIKSETLEAFKGLSIDSLRDGSENISEQLDRAYKAKGNNPPAIEPKKIDQFFSDKLSGVYQNPLKPEHTLSIYFFDDSNAESRIKSDIDRYELSEDSYQQHQVIGQQVLSAMNKTPKGNVSQHVMTIKDADNVNSNDANLTFIDTRDNLKDFAGGDKYGSYYLLMHEASHALPFQQTTFEMLMDHSKAEREQQVLFREISADFIATTKTAQLMLDDGVPKSDVVAMLEQRILERNHEVENVFGQQKELMASDHYTSPAIAMVKELVNNDPEYVKSVSNEDLAKDSERLAESLLQYDFMEELRSLESTPAVQNDARIHATLANSKEHSRDPKDDVGHISNPVTQHILSNYHGAPYERFIEDSMHLLTSASQEMYDTRDPHKVANTRVN